MCVKKENRSLNVREFHDLCRAYRAQKDRYFHLEKKLRSRESANDRSLRMQEELLRKNIRLIDDFFEEVSNSYGICAEQILRDYYVDAVTQSELSYRYGIPLRTLQRRMKQWVTCTLEKI